MTVMRAMIVDDERLARQQLGDLLSEYETILLTGEVSSVSEAIVLLEMEAPEVIFLDISMPPDSGFDLLPHVPPDTRVVFVTAHADHAVRAFEENMLDYLLKPVTRERLAVTMKRIEEALGLPVVGRPLLLSDGRIWKQIPPSGISVVFAEGNYSRLHSMTGDHFVLRRTLKEWFTELADPGFLQLSRSMLVNPAAIVQIEKLSRDSANLRIRGIKEDIPLGRLAVRQVSRAMKRR